MTDELDALGNTTKATTKAFAVMSAALAAVAIFEAFQHEASRIIAANASVASKYAVIHGRARNQFSRSDP